MERLQENNIRKGFVENDKFWIFYVHLPRHLKPLVLFAYETGCRKSLLSGYRLSAPNN